MGGLDGANFDLYFRINTGLRIFPICIIIRQSLKKTYMSQDKLIKMKSADGKLIIYTQKNKKQNPDKLVRRKYSKVTRKHEVFSETKK